MRVLVTGATGMLGSDLCEELLKNHQVTGLARGEHHPPVIGHRLPSFLHADITNALSISDAISSVRPNVVIHAAAYTDVDGCELNSDMAYQVNALGTQNVATACKDAGAALIYISTDYVFDGEKGSPYNEEDYPNPISVYGRSKLRGEEYIKALLGNYAIVRTSWLYGRNGRNFVDGIIERARRGEELRVVNDQFGSPTWTADLSKAIQKIIERITHDACLPAGRALRMTGIYHITNGGSCSRYEEALSALKYSKFPNAQIRPVSSAESGRPARRPRNSALENRRYREIFGETLRPWDEALQEYLI